MTAHTTGFIGTFRQYAGKLKTMRDEMRTRRFLDSLPNDIRKDIGWPDRYPQVDRFVLNTGRGCLAVPAPPPRQGSLFLTGS